MIKGVTHKKSNKFNNRIFFLLITILVFIVSAGLTVLFLNDQDAITAKPTLPKVPLVKAATTSANINASPSASPTPKPLPIPVNYGRQVRVPILLYHYIGNNPNPADKARDHLSVPPDKFDEQLGYLAKSGYTPISMDILYNALKGNGGLPAKPIILTFDDGYIDLYINAYPILKKYGFKAVSYIPTGLINQGYYLSWAQIQEMNSSGLIDFETHSVNHVNLTALPYDKLMYQLTESKRVLESHLGRSVNFMAYPYGTSNEIVWEAVKKAGYLSATGTWYGEIESEGTIYDLPRVKIPGGITVENFAKRF